MKTRSVRKEPEPEPEPEKDEEPEMSEPKFVASTMSAMDPWAERKEQQALMYEGPKPVQPPAAMNGRYYDLVKDKRKVDLPYEKAGTTYMEELEFFQGGKEEYDDTAQFTR